MAQARGCLFLLTCAAMILVRHCQAVLLLPPPSKLSYEWEDVFKVNVSWERPTGLPPDGQFSYIYRKGGSEESSKCIQDRHFIDTCFTDEIDDGGCTFDIRTVPKDCSTNSTYVSLTIDSPKPQAELVKDIKCPIYPQIINCSWIPVTVKKLTLYYRESHQENVTECNQRYSSGERKGCSLPIHFQGRDIFIHLDSDAGMRTLKVRAMLATPELNIREEGGHLNLTWTWTPPELGRECGFKYEVHYVECDIPQIRKFETKRFELKNNMLVPYDNRCLYNFRCKVETDHYCLHLSSDFSDFVSYGSNKPPDRTLTVVAIVIPTILSICVLLSCYCFRRHRAIICPTIPDPSVIFKEMMMSGNKEPMSTSGSVYTPVPEPIEHITIATEESTSEQSC